MSNTLATYTTKVQNEVDDTSDRAKSVIEQAIKDTYQEIIRLVGEKIIGTTEEPITATASQRYITPTNNFQDIKSVLWKNTSTDEYTLLERMTEEDYYKEYIRFGIRTEIYGKKTIINKDLKMEFKNYMIQEVIFMFKCYIKIMKELNKKFYNISYCKK
jgi:hypothetical protein